MKTTEVSCRQPDDAVVPCRWPYRGDPLPLASLLFLTLVSACGGSSPSRPAIAANVSPHIGFVGCSMARNTFAGWAGLSDEVWPVDRDTSAYGGMVIGRWADVGGGGAAAWADFESMMTRFPATDVVVVQVCGNKVANSARSEHLEVVVGELQRRHPGLRVMIGWQPEYEVGHECQILSSASDTTQESIARIREVAQRGVELDLGQPDASPLGPLGPSTTSDGCHANAAGEALLGQQMSSWWTTRAAVPGG